MELRTDRLLLRPIAPDDLDAFLALETELRAAETPPRPAPARAESARYLALFVGVWERGDHGYWTILRDDAVIGFGGVQPKSWRGARCWNLYYRVRPAHQRDGVATELGRAALLAAAHAHPTWPVVVQTAATNAAAIGVATRLGLRRLPAAADDEQVTLVFEP